MRAAALAILFAAIARPAFAGPCTGAEAQLARLSAKLTATSGARKRCSPQFRFSSRLPGAALAEGRIEAAKGNAQAAADLYVQYTDLELRTQEDLPTLAGSFSDQRDYPKADALSAAAMETQC